MIEMSGAKEMPLTPLKKCLYRLC